MKRRRWVWISVGAIVVVLVTGIAVAWSSLLARVPVRPSIANGTLVLTSHSEAPWVARVAAGGVPSVVDVGPRQVVQVPIPPGSRSFEIELLRTATSEPGWTITYEPPHASFNAGGVDAGAGYSVSATLTELLKVGGK